MMRITINTKPNKLERSWLTSKTHFSRRSAMTKLIYAATVTLACITSISTTLVGSSIGSKVLAAEGTCSFLTGSTTTGGSVREQLDANAHCNSSNQPSAVAEPSIQQGTKMSSIKTMPDAVQSSNQDNGYPAYCPALPAGLNPGDFAFQEALATCKYGL